MQTKLRSDAFLQQAMDTCGDAVYRLALCRLNSRGALISMAVILLVLPALLVLTAPILKKTTFHWIQPQKAEICSDNCRKDEALL